jgi:hypothetical protein
MPLATPEIRPFARAVRRSLQRISLWRQAFGRDPQTKDPADKRKRRTGIPVRRIQDTLTPKRPAAA